MAAEETRANPAPGTSSKGRFVGILVVAGLMGAEGIGVFLLAKAVSPTPVPVLAANAKDGNDAGVAEDALVEVQIAECRPSNMMTGKFVTFHIRVSALVAAEELERAETIIRRKRARLEDSVNTVIRSAEPKHLTEPGLETIKRRLKQEFGDIFSDDQLVQDVLIPQMLQSGPGV